MPEISRFYGIVIKMFYKPKEQELVKEWIAKNQSELLKMWDKQSIKKLPPL